MNEKMPTKIVTPGSMATIAYPSPKPNPNPNPNPKPTTEARSHGENKEKTSCTAETRRRALSWSRLAIFSTEFDG
jgi:hypothetical protein